ncbi:hypothetical protein [Microbulbifer variabilis]|uniref:hypothetical protein n=1 Tax=Microbulbifer variabilis TaxID=266805 RepID=UPI001CFEB3A3|nr:hypothetical protein [Microbulbifer variabilis]
MLQQYPEPSANKIDEETEAAIVWLKQTIEGMRNIFCEMNISPTKKIPLILRNGSARDRELLVQA